MIRKTIRVALGALFLSAQAPAQVEPAVAFGAREGIEFIALSPDGTRVAYAIPWEGQGSRVYTVEVGGTTPRPTISIDGERHRLGGCNWVSNSRLACTLWGVTESLGQLLAGSRLIALDIDGTNVRMLGQSDNSEQAGFRLWGGSIVDWLPGEENQVLMQQVFIPDSRLGSGRDEEGIGVVRVDTRDGGTRRVEAPRPGSFRFLTDGRGTVRVMSAAQAREPGVTNHFYRRRESSEWLRLGTHNALTDRGVWPLAVDAERDAVYVMEQDANGRDTVFRMALDGSERRDLTIAHPVVDIDGVIRLGRRGRVIGVTHATERRQANYFDEELQRVAQQLSRALPGQPLIDFVGASDDESKLLIRAGSDNDPGTFYVLDRRSLSLTPLMRSRPELEGFQLATVRPVTYRAADGTVIPAYLTMPPGRESARGLPAIVMPHGGPGARDEWGFDWLPQFFANRGYAVLQPNYRGSAGYGEAWFQTNGFQSWRTAIGDVNDAGRFLVSEGIADPAKLAIVGWSYGGYAALQSAVVDPALFRAIVAIAPVADLEMARDDWRNLGSRNFSRDFFGMGPHIAEGSPARHAAAIRAPVLMFHGAMDINVHIRHARLMRDRLRDAGRTVELVEHAALDHYLDDSRARADMLRRSDAFLRQALGIQ